MGGERRGVHDARDARASESEAWVAALRERLARGELAVLGPLELGDGTPPMDGELLVRISLADLDHYVDLTPTYRCQPDVAARRQAVLDGLRRLRELIG